MVLFKGNKGEWSEPYVLFELLSEGKIYKSDANLRVIQDVWHDISSIIFKIDKNDEEGSLRFQLCTNDNGERRIILYNGGNVPVAIEYNECKKYADGLRKILSDPKQKSDGILAVPQEYTDFLLDMGRETLKTGAKSKSDIWLDLPDVRNTENKPLGFSIKSDFGSPPSVFNSGNTSNIVYKIKTEMTVEQIDAINGMLSIYENDKTHKKNYYPDYSARVQYFKDNMLELEFYHEYAYIKVKGNEYDNIRFDSSRLTDDDTFEKNLRMVDYMMPSLYGLMAYHVFFDCITKLPDMIDKLNEEDPLGMEPTDEYPYYKKKVQDLLVAMTLSMNPGTIWDGTESTNGGMIIVKDTGDIVCYHIFDRDDFRDFLLQNMHFDKPSGDRYHMMELYRQDDGTYLTQLNVQIRM